MPVNINRPQQIFESPLKSANQPETKEIGGSSHICVVCQHPVTQAETKEIGGGSHYCVICHTASSPADVA